MKRYLQWLSEQDTSGIRIEPSQGDGWKIIAPYGYVDYRHDAATNTNEIWWIEVKPGHQRQGYAKRLVDVMQQKHPADSIAWGVTTPQGKRLRDSWHRDHPTIEKIDGAFEGQFDPSGDNYGEDLARWEEEFA